jgi:hypothetical protein
MEGALSFPLLMDSKNNFISAYGRHSGVRKPNVERHPEMRGDTTTPTGVALVVLAWELFFFSGEVRYRENNPLDGII